MDEYFENNIFSEISKEKIKNRLHLIVDNLSFDDLVFLLRVLLSTVRTVDEL